MKTSDFYYDLPDSLIAQTPIEPRDHSRLLVAHRSAGTLEHRHFYDLPDYLNPGDALVINDTRVMPARLIGTRADGGKCEVLLLRQISQNIWETLVKPGKKLKPGATVSFKGGRLTGLIAQTTPAGGRVIAFSCEGAFEAALHELGEMPLPPYIKERLVDKERYQTVYAKSEGSIAAPTAGLHFTPGLLKAIEQKGVEIIPVRLNVGLGTFKPVQVDDPGDHIMHSEYFEVSEGAVSRVNAVKARKNRVFAVGTTGVRALESSVGPDGALSPQCGFTDMYITPGYAFRATDCLITNFHLPCSTLIMLVAAFMGLNEALAAYREAVSKKYRFFSFGDAMLIL
jgi:S-adenosylmethionine:tRNA ribosyltransferase-isomerase